MDKTSLLLFSACTSRGGDASDDDEDWVEIEQQEEEELEYTEEVIGAGGMSGGRDSDSE